MWAALHITPAYNFKTATSCAPWLLWCHHIGIPFTLRRLVTISLLPLPLCHLNLHVRQGRKTIFPRFSNSTVSFVAEINAIFLEANKRYKLNFVFLETLQRFTNRGKKSICVPETLQKMRQHLPKQTFLCTIITCFPHLKKIWGKYCPSGRFYCRV